MGRLPRRYRTWRISTYFGRKKEVGKRNRSRNVQNVHLYVCVKK